MKSKYIRIHMGEEYFESNARIVSHISVKFHLLLIPFINYYNIELNLILSSLDCFVQKLVLLVVINFRYIFEVKVNSIARDGIIYDFCYSVYFIAVTCAVSFAGDSFTICGSD